MTYEIRDNNQFNSKEETSMFDYTQSQESYLTAKKAKGLRPLSLQNAERILNLYKIYTDENQLLPQESQSVQSWQISLLERCKPTTAAQYMVVLKDFFLFCIEAGTLSENPVKTIPKAKRPRTYGNLLSPQEIKTLLTARRPKLARHDVWARNKAIVTILLTTSIRNSELRELKVSDISWQENTLYIHGKGGVDRYVSMPQVCVGAIKEYLDGQEKTGYLFSIGNHPIDRITLSEIVNRYVRLVTGREGIRTHALRHASACLMVTAGTNMSEIQQKLGHQNYATTEIYAQKLTHTQENSAAVFDALVK